MKSLPPIPSSEITPETVYRTRRRFVMALGAGAVASAAGLRTKDALARTRGTSLPTGGKSALSSNETPSSFETITTYNNFYEFGPNKDDPARNAPPSLTPKPWTVAVDGEVKTPRTFGLDDILKFGALEERVFRHRCVEGWSMVVPWVGFSLSEFIRRCEPTGNAHFVEFWSLADPAQMPYIRLPLLEWPYREGLRMDEAMHPLATLAVGLYGDVLPTQNGAPLRLVVPWKYGFKGAKSIVRIRFVEKQPVTTWMNSGPSEYGFYSNVNPEVDHPRWSQARERRLGEFFKRKTLMFNGYADQVASLYRGLDLRANF
jgi:sulfoxide reductase catalytic subunit YedY